MDARIDAQPIGTRVRVGKELEAQVLQVLTERHGLPLEKGNHQDDCVRKTDWYYILKGHYLPCAFKGRATKEDILVAVRDPWSGPIDPENYIGRDMLVKYLFYFSLSPDTKVIRAARGSVIHSICNDMWQELKDKDFVLTWGKVMKSEKHPGCELRHHIDRYKGHKKILGFIPPSYLTTNRDVWYYENKLQ